MACTPARIDAHRTEGTGAHDHRRQGALDALAIRKERKARLDVRVDVGIGAESAERTPRRLDQLDHFARLLVQHEAAGLDARDFQHLFEKGVEAFRLPLQDLDVPRIAGLAFLQPPRQRVGEPLDAGERRLQLMRGEREETVLAGLALGGGEHRGGAGEERLQRAQVAQPSVEDDGEGADDLVVHEQRHRRRAFTPFDVPALQAAARQLRGTGLPVAAEHLQPGAGFQVDGDAGGAREPPGDARDAPRELARVLALEGRVGELGRRS